jgi:GxxExxY protein
MILDNKPKKKYEKIPQHVENAASAAVDSAFHVHRNLGPYLPERYYERFMIVELEQRGCNVKRQVKFPLLYEGVDYGEYFIIDLLVDDCLVLELKRVETILPVHKYQILSYLKLSGLRLGLLINFGDVNIGSGITRVIN